MIHTTSEIKASAAESEFMEIMRHADDFFKIELLRQAKNWYKKALALNIETDKVKQKIAECDSLLAYENKVIGILGAIAVVLLVIYFLF